MVPIICGSVVFTYKMRLWYLGYYPKNFVCIQHSITEFCTVEDEFHPFWTRVQDQAVESYTMKEVFDMDSSVRVEAIENLGKDGL